MQLLRCQWLALVVVASVLLLVQLHNVDAAGSGHPRGDGRRPKPPGRRRQGAPRENPEGQGPEMVYVNAPFWAGRYTREGEDSGSSEPELSDEEQEELLYENIKPYGTLATGEGSDRELPLGDAGRLADQSGGSEPIYENVSVATSSDRVVDTGMQGDARSRLPAPLPQIPSTYISFVGETGSRGTVHGGGGSSEQGGRDGDPVHSATPRRGSPQGVDTRPPRQHRRFVTTVYTTVRRVGTEDSEQRGLPGLPPEGPDGTEDEVLYASLGGARHAGVSGRPEGWDIYPRVGGAEGPDTGEATRGYETVGHYVVGQGAWHPGAAAGPRAGADTEEPEAEIYGELPWVRVQGRGHRPGDGDDSEEEDDYEELPLGSGRRPPDDSSSLSGSTHLGDSHPRQQRRGQSLLQRLKELFSRKKPTQ